MGHVVGEALLVCLEGGRPAVGGPVVGWWVDVVVGIVISKKTEEPLDIDGLNFEKLLAGEGSRPIVTRSGAAMEELHETAELGMVAPFEGHMPAAMVTLKLIK